MKPTKIMLLSDAVTAHTGLGRITRDLAIRMAAMPEFDVCTIGYGGGFDRTLPFPQYFIYNMTDWLVGNLPEAWANFAGDEKGILMPIWDASRLLWLTQPEAYCRDQKMREFLATKPFKLWTYSAIDATGPNDKLSVLLREVLKGFDRVLAYSEWSARIIERTLDAPEGTIPALPHGIDPEVWRPRMKEKARRVFGEQILGDSNFSIPEDVLMIGVVATNQRRKDWGTAIEAAAMLAKERNVMLWVHTDTPEREWSISALLYDYEMQQKTIVTHGNTLNDEQMKWAYSACDVTWGIGLGEGYGYPIFESLACGVPCIHGNYGGAPEYMPAELLIEPLAYRKEQMFGSVRPVFDAKQWVEQTLEVIGKECTLPEVLDWEKLWPRYKDWLLAGLNEPKKLELVK